MKKQWPNKKLLLWFLASLFLCFGTITHNLATASSLRNTSELDGDLDGDGDIDNDDRTIFMENVGICDPLGDYDEDGCVTSEDYRIWCDYYLEAQELGDLFGIYTGTLKGGDLRPLVFDSYREMNHARVSPDKKWVVFTRYNRKGPNGLAEETGGNYLETELMTMRLDGTELRTLIPPRPGTVAANGYWADGGQSIVYVSNDNDFSDNPKRKMRINRINLITGTITRIPIPAQVRNFHVADPHQVGNQIVFTAVSTEGGMPVSVVWIMDRDGSNGKQLTFPSFATNDENLSALPGDFDPKLSPDGSMVAVMRHIGEDNWHIVVVDVETGEEKDLSEVESVDAVPEWSSDGTLLIFWYVNTKNIRNSGLSTVNPDGSKRKKVSLPRGYFYTMPAFFPEEAGKNTEIIFSAKKIPGWQ